MSATTNDLRRIWDRRTRRGENLLHYLPDAEAAAKAVRTARNSLRATRRSQLATRSDTEKAAALLKSESLAFDNAVTNGLAATAQNLRATATLMTSWGLSAGPTIHGKPTYKLNYPNAESYFRAQITTERLRRLSPKPINRAMATSRLAIALDDALPKTIYRFDISNFFESIPHEQLLERIFDMTRDAELVASCSALLNEYSAISGNAAGVPRGVAASSWLAELYLNEVDRELRTTDGVFLYLRYVDDIVAITAGTRSTDVANLIGVNVSNLGLSLNASKTSTIPAKAGQFKDLRFLGYEYSRPQKALKVHLTPTKLATLRSRLDVAFAAWDSHPSTNTGRQGLLLDRIRLLTGNYRLFNNRRQAIAGLRFSYPLLTDTGQLVALDTYLEQLINTRKWPSAKFEQSLRACSFKVGYEEQVFWQMSSKRISKATGVWRA